MQTYNYAYISIHLPMYYVVEYIRSEILICMYSSNISGLF